MNAMRSVIPRAALPQLSNGPHPQPASAEGVLEPLDRAPRLPGISVVLEGDPRSPVMTVTQIRRDVCGAVYTVVWLDPSRQRLEAQYAEAELLRVLN